MAAFRQLGKKIVAVGRNFADHAKEMNSPLPKQPLVFLKPTSSYCSPGQSIRIPRNCNVHHEVELAVVIDRNAKCVSEKEAMSYVKGYALAIDVTARTLQEIAKKEGAPWTVSKGFDTFTPITDMVPLSRIKDPNILNLWLRVNGSLKQNGNTRDFIFSIPHIVSHISQVMTLEAYDVILMGTPKGVGPMADGDQVEVGLEQDNEIVLHGKWMVKDLTNKLFL